MGFRALFTGPGDVGGRLQQNISCSDAYLRGSCISTVHCAEIFTGVGSQDFLTGLVVDFLQVTPTPFHITLTIICWVTKSWTERFIRSDTYQQYIGALTVNGGRVEIGVGSHDFLTALISFSDIALYPCALISSTEIGFLLSVHSFFIATVASPSGSLICVWD